jgi:acetyl esterase/lipase
VPQYPFPCAVLDVLSSYIYLLNPFEITGNEILILKNSAVGDLILELLLCLLRDMGLLRRQRGRFFGRDGPR